MTTIIERQGKIAPGPQGNFLLGSLLDMQRQGMIEFYVDSWKKIWGHSALQNGTDELIFTCTSR